MLILLVAMFLIQCMGLPHFGQHRAFGPTALGSSGSTGTASSDVGESRWKFDVGI
jgi:hypothetical protein